MLIDLPAPQLKTAAMTATFMTVAMFTVDSNSKQFDDMGKGVGHWADIVKYWPPFETILAYIAVLSQRVD